MEWRGFGPKPKPISERLASKTVPEPNSGCWLWEGTVTKGGYGRIRRDYRGEYITTHRAAWEIYHGEIPEGMFVCHTCDTPSCVNPSHLFLGTHEHNQADMREKGRGWWQKSRGGTRKLSDQEVREIRQDDSRLQRELAEQYGVNPSAISKIKSFNLYGNVV